MYKNMKVGIVVPAYNEEDHIGEVLKTMPDYIDYILVFDDHSQDDTSKIVQKYRKHDKRITLIRNEKNMGNGYAARTGFQMLCDMGADAMGAMAGDGQTEPQYLPSLLDPVAENKCDVAKGNRFLEKAVYKNMPRYRYIGNIFVTMLNKFSTGYYSMYDSLNGYYIAKAEVMKKIELDKLGDRYHFENSFWIQLNIVDARIKDVSMPPIYKNEQSKIRLRKVVLPTLWTLQKGFVKRIFLKYVLYNFSPIGLFYITGTLLTWWGILFGLIIVLTSIGPHTPPSTATVMIAVVPFILGFELLLQAVVLDIQAEPKSS